MTATPTTLPPLSEQDAAAAVARILRRQRRHALRLVGVAAFNSAPSPLPDTWRRRIIER